MCDSLLFIYLLSIAWHCHTHSFIL